MSEQAAPNVPAGTVNLSTELDAVFGALREHEGRLKSRAAQLDTQEKTLRELQTTLDGVRHELDARTQAVTEQEQAVAKANAENQATAAALTQKQNNLNGEEQRLKTLREELERQQADVVARRAEAAGKEQQLKQQEQLMANSRDHMLKLCEEISSLQQEIERVAAAPPPTPEAAGPQDADAGEAADESNETDPAMAKLRRDVKRRAMGV